MNRPTWHLMFSWLNIPFIILSLHGLTLGLTNKPLQFLGLLKLTIRTIAWSQAYDWVQEKNCNANYIAFSGQILLLDRYVMWQIMCNFFLSLFSLRLVLLGVREGKSVLCFSTEKASLKKEYNIYFTINKILSYHLHLFKSWMAN